jgi:hypothetical protein
MKARIFSSLEEAEAARALVDADYGLPRVHREGEYSSAEAGRAAERIRARGVMTEHAVELVPSYDGVQFALPADDPEALDLDLGRWRGAGRDRRPRHA